MSQKAAPTYNPPAPVMAASGQDLYNQGQQWYQQNQPGLYNAQSTALANANDRNYYNSWGPTSLDQALGSQYFQNVWPDESAAIKQQFSQSGLSSSPALAETLGRAQGGLETQVGSYLSTQAQQEATNAINAGLGISQSSLLNPYVTTAGNQSNINTGYQNNYNQALAQQQYQQQYNNYSQNNALASTLGQISPIGGAIYGASTGTSGSALGGTAQSLGQLSPLIFSGMTGGLSGANAAGQYGGGTTTGSNGMPLGGYSSAGGQNPYSNGASSVYGPAQTSNVNPGSFQY